jgi:hypothetical protein
LLLLPEAAAHQLFEQLDGQLTVAAARSPESVGKFSVTATRWALAAREQ